MLFHGTPSPGNTQARERFERNRFTVTRQLRYNRDETQRALDIGLFINGLAVFTFELKNNLTKQTVGDAVWQYRRDRDPSEKLFGFGRCIAHFAVDENRDTIRQYAQVRSTVGHAERSGDLRRFIEQGKKIIISTVQKFPFILDEIGDEHRGRRFAIIIDEAHSSQGGRTAAAMSRALSETGAGGEAETFEDQVNRAMESRKLLPNASRFAFTATPKNRTLQIFGEPDPQPDGTVKHRAFHTYTMKQAIQDGFPSRDITEKFRTDPYRFLVCADKFQTGYDEPLLHTMYVDKTLAGIMDNRSFKRWMTDTVFALAFEHAEAPETTANDRFVSGG